MVWLEISNFVHFVGLAFGLGGATIATIISRKAEKDKDVALAFGKIMPAVSKLIFFGLILLIISGIALPFLISWPLDKNMLLVKHVLVAWIVIFGIVLGRTSRKLSKLSLDGRKPVEFLRLKKVIKSVSMINLFLWYAVTLMSAFV